MYKISSLNVSIHIAFGGILFAILCFPIAIFAATVTIYRCPFNSCDLGEEVDPNNIVGEYGDYSIENLGDEIARVNFDKTSITLTNARIIKNNNVPGILKITSQGDPVNLSTGPWRSEINANGSWGGPFVNNDIFTIKGDLWVAPPGIGTGASGAQAPPNPLAIGPRYSSVIAVPQGGTGALTLDLNIGLANATALLELPGSATVSAVPIPATLGLFASGIAGLGLLRHRKRRQS